MRIIGILQLLIGISGLILGSMMTGDIGIAAMIGAVTSLLSGAGFLLPESKSRKMGRKTKLGMIISGTAALLLVVIGLALSSVNDKTVSREEFLTEQQFVQLYTDAKPFKGYQVDFYGRVFQAPEKTEKYQSFQVYAQDDDSKNTIVRLDDMAVDIQKGDILHIVGEVHDMFQGKNAFGAILKLPAIIAKKVEKTDYATAFAPAFKTIEVNQEQNQNGYVMSVTNVELAKQETRVHLKVRNESADTIDFHTYSSTLIQGDKQYERISNFHANYPEINSDNIRPSVTTEGVIVFPSVDPNGDNFTVTFEGSSDNWEVRIEPFTFEIPLKHEVTVAKDELTNRVHNDKESPLRVTENGPKTPIDTWPSMSSEKQVELNRFFSDLSSVNFGTSPYIRDSKISQYSTDELIRFAIERNQQFGLDNSYVFNPDNENELMMHQDLIAETIEHFFGIQIKHKSISGYQYKDGYYRWDAYRWAYTDSNLFSQVQQLFDNQDGTLTAVISVYQDLSDYGFFNSDDPDHLQAKAIRYQPQAAWPDSSNFSYVGSVAATIKKSESDDWIVIDYKVESMY
ncbi:DUF308 domain-containing protein [Cohnella massiliensis]|uniref:DUF308 domain-containing protein n=1 Tax=Cohnella massiliensis TaxID=1816691 RepID=UPI0009BA6C89|nr:DUF308 domain-containing protein [Cohnella massiliensis]